MDWQQIITFIIVGISLALLVRSEWRKHTRRKNSICGSDCSCPSKNFVPLSHSHSTRTIHERNILQ